MPLSSLSVSRVKAMFASASVLLVLLLTHPYRGLQHDGILYLGQILRHIQPELASDVFFAHGSQDRYSIYSVLMGPLYQWLPINLLQMLVLAATTLASLAALYQLLRELGARAAWLGLVCVVACHRFYGGLGIFAFGEDFLTARSLAEPVLLWALVFTVRKRDGAAVGALLLASALHPLLALPVWVIAWLHWQARDARWRWALLLSLLPVGLAFAGIAPFDSLLRRYNAQTWAWIEEANGHVVLRMWDGRDWQRLLIDFALLAGLAWAAPPQLRTLARATGAAAVGLLGLSAVAVDGVHIELLTALQLWRALWLVHALALAGLPWLLTRLWQSETQFGLARLGALFLTASALAADARIEQTWVLATATALALLAAQRRTAVARNVLRLAAAVALLCMLAITLGVVLLASTPGYGYLTPPIEPVWLSAVREPAVALGLTALLWRGLAAHGARQIAACFGLLTLLLLAVTQWDRRSDWTRLLEDGGLQRKHPFTQIIEPGAQVYWHRDLAATWLLLGRASYYGKAQGAGLLFNEGTARDFGPRREKFKAVEQRITDCRITAALTNRSEDDCVTPSVETIADLCRSEVHLDYLVFARRLDRPGLSPLASWNPQLSSYPDLRFHLYACKQFR